MNNMKNNIIVPEENNKDKNDAENTITVSAVIENEKPPETKQAKKSRKIMKASKPAIWILHSLQRGLLVAGAIFLAYVLMNSVVFIMNEQGAYRSYYIAGNFTGSESVFEDSTMFNGFLTNKIEDIIKFGAIRSQMETNGRFDSEKIIDITAFASRYYSIPTEYITAHYYLSDLIKWAQNGFVYTPAHMNESELNDFLAPENIYFSMVSENEIDETDYDDTIVNVEIRLRNEEVRRRSFYEINDVHFIFNYEDDSDYDRASNVRENILIYIQEFAEYGIYVHEVYILNDDIYVHLEDGRYELIDVIISEYEELRQINENWANLIYGYRLLNNQYLTVEGKGIEFYVADYENYQKLCYNLENAAADLNYNFRQYERFLKLFNNSNVNYLIYKPNDNGGEFLANFDLPEDISFPAIDSLFSEMGKYIKYNPDDFIYETNTAIPESILRNSISNYQYIYPDKTQIWIGVDTNYPITDIFWQGYQGYQRFFPYYIQFIGAAFFCFIMFFIMMIILSILTGRTFNENGEFKLKLRRFDSIYTEIWVLLSVTIIGGMIIFMSLALYNNRILNWLSQERDTWSIPIVAIYVYIFSLFFSLFYYSIVRRIKARSLWRDSILKRLIRLLVFIGKGVGFGIKKFISFSYHNLNLLGRYLVPTLLVVFYHIIMISFIANIRHNSELKFLLALLIIIIDIVIGALFFMSARVLNTIVDGINKISGGNLKHKVDEKGLRGDNLILAKAVNRIGDTVNSAVEISLRDERMKADLITNVSHDIKTPLTSIINYIDLIKRENIEDSTIRNYVNILDQKSQRLKQLTDDLVEASKISSGNIELKLEKINLTELVNQTIGEFTEKFALRNLQINVKAKQDKLYIEADSRRIWRVVENLFDNIYKYAMENTRIYIEIIPVSPGQAKLTIKNISEQPLNFNADELTERFIRGDVSRSTEGSGLGLSIAKNLTEAQNGWFEIKMDGDLFKVNLTFPLVEFNPELSNETDSEA